MRRKGKAPRGRHPLLAEADAWATEHGCLLANCFARFQDSGEWPTLEQLQHDFEVTGRSEDVSRLAFAMPRPLGFVEQQRLVFLARALSHVPAAAQLLEDWAAVLELAYRKWRDDPDAQLARADVLRVLDGDSERARFVALLLMRERWPFGSGHGGPDDEWSQEIISAVRDAREADGPGDIIAARDRTEFPQVAPVPSRIDTSLQGATDPPGSGGHRGEGLGAIPSRLTVLIGALTLAGVVITIATAPSWLAAGAIAAAIMTCLLHRAAWRPRPAPWALLAIGGVAMTAAVIAQLVSQGSSEKERPKASSVPVESRSVGQIEAGNITRASTVDMPRTFEDPLRAEVGSMVTVAIRLSNVGPDEIFETSVRAVLPTGAARALSIKLLAEPKNANPPEVADTATIDLADGATACAVYVAGSTRLYDAHWGLIRELPDGVVGNEVMVDRLGVAIEDVRFVSFDVQLVRATPDSGPEGCR